MSDDFGTVNVRRGDRGREIERLRQHYRQHRDALASLASEAPTEALAAEYQRLIRDIDTALAKLNELEGVAPAAPPTEPGSRPLVTPPPYESGAAPTPGNSRLALIVVAGVIVLAIIAYLIYRASGDRRHTTTAITESTTAASTAPSTIEPVTPAPATAAPAAGALAVNPAIADYGTIRKGTRAARQLEVTNNSAEPLQIKVSRSQCRCLFYEYKETIAPKGKETLTVTVDGARAKAGALQETIDVTSKKDPSVAASFQVSATIK